MDTNILPDELRTVFRLSLGPTSDIFHALQDLGDPIDVHDPRIRKLVEAILFSRRFILTYYIALLSIVILWAGFRWRTILRRTKVESLEKESDLQTSSVASSSSSTLIATEISLPKQIDDDETLPLLRRASQGLENPPTSITRVCRHVKAALVTQPKPVPSLTTDKNVLPSNGVSLLVLLFLALNVFYLFYRTPMSWSMLFAFGDRAALVFVVNLPVVYIFGAKNNQPLRWLTGWSYEGLNLFHRRLGELMTVTALIHGVTMIIVWSILLRPLGFSLGWYLTRKIILFGILALLAYFAIYVTSIGFVRRTCYELFLGLHIFLQAAALIFLLLHHHNARPYVGAAFAISLLDRIVFRGFLVSSTFVGDLEIAKDGETVLVFANIPVGKSKTGIRAGWHSGQHVFLTVLGMGQNYDLQAHPFTIASPAPPQSAVNQTWPLLLVVRAQTGFSKCLLDYAQHHQHTRVRIDGPYGSTDVLKAIKTSDRTCFIAGGSGIAVTYPLACHYCFGASPDIEKPVSLRTLYLNGKRHVPLVRVGKLATKRHTYAHLWVRQRHHHDDWIKFLPHGNKLICDIAAPQRYLNKEEDAVDLITDRFATRDASCLSSARPDISLEVREWIESSGTAKINKDESICIVVSGPDTLVRGVRNSAASLIKEGWKVQVWVEKFGW